jgi:hypothetical protein
MCIHIYKLDMYTYKCIGSHTGWKSIQSISHIFKDLNWLRRVRVKGIRVKGIGARKMGIKGIGIFCEMLTFSVLLFLRKASASSTNKRTPLLVVFAQSNNLWISVTASLPSGATSPMYIYIYIYICIYIYVYTYTSSHDRVVKTKLTDKYLYI